MTIQNQINELANASVEQDSDLDTLKLRQDWICYAIRHIIDELGIQPPKPLSTFNTNEDND